MLEVRVAEMSRDLIRGSASISDTCLPAAASSPRPRSVEFPRSRRRPRPVRVVPVAANALLRFTAGGDQWTVFFDS